MTHNSQLSSQSSQITAKENISHNLNPIEMKDNQKLSSESNQGNIQGIENKFNQFPKIKTIFIGGVLFLALIATIAIFTGDNQFCLLSYCENGGGGSDSIGGDFWALLGGSVAYIIATTMGVTMLPAVGIALGIWFLMQISL